MIFIYNKKTKQVKMMGDKISYDTDIMAKKTIKPTKEELKHIKDNDVICIKENKLSFQDNAFKAKAKKRTDKLKKIDKCKNLDEVKDLLKELI